MDWFNAVDLTYQNQLRELNEMNSERFKAEVRAQGAELRAEMARLRSDMMKWMFIRWVATVVPLLWAILYK